MSRPLIPAQPLDLVGLDRQTLLARLRWCASQGFNNWVDYSLASPENVLLEAQALLGSMTFSLLNEKARQLTFATITDRLMMIRKAAPMGLSLTSASAATVEGVFSTATGVVATVRIPIPVGTRLQTGSSQFQVVTAGAEILVGALVSGVVTLENSETQPPSIFPSDGAANQILKLAAYPVIDGSVTVTAADGVYSLTRPDNHLPYRSFLEMDGIRKGCIFRCDNEGKGYLFFGNGINGAVPQGNIEVLYKTGGGSSGRVTAGATWTLLDPVYDDLGNLVTVLFTNALAASVGGLDQMSVEEARIRLPMQARVLERTVNEDDAAAVAEGVGGIARAALFTSNDTSTIPEDVGRLFLVALGAQYDSLVYALSGDYYPPATPTAAQIAEVTTRLARGGAAPSIMCARVTTYAAIFRTINITVRIYKAAGVLAADARIGVEDVLQRYFAVADADRAPLYTVGFGVEMLGYSGAADFELPWSDVFETITASPAVRKIPTDANALLLNGSRASVFLLPTEFPILGTITIYDMDNAGASI